MSLCYRGTGEGSLPRSGYGICGDAARLPLRWLDLRHNRGMNGGYRVFDHTADVGLEAWGLSPSEAFAAAARGMVAIMLGQDPLEWSGNGAPCEFDVNIEGADWEELLVNWLAEILFHVEVDGFVPRGIEIAECAPPRCRSFLSGVCAEESGSFGGVGIKAVTYHQLKLEVGTARTELRLIFDI